MWSTDLFKILNAQRKARKNTLVFLLKLCGTFMTTVALCGAPSAFADDNYSYSSPIFTYSLYGTDVTASSIAELKQNFEAKERAVFAQCTSKERYSCFERTVINVGPTPGWGSVNGIPIFQSMYLML